MYEVVYYHLLMNMFSQNARNCCFCTQITRNGFFFIAALLLHLFFILFLIYRFEMRKINQIIDSRLIYWLTDMILPKPTSIEFNLTSRWQCGNIVVLIEKKTPHFIHAKRKTARGFTSCNFSK